MQNHSGFPRIHQRSENLAIALVLSIFTVLSLIVLPTLRAKLTVIGLLLLFGLLYALVYRRAKRLSELLLYFAAQSLVLVGLIWFGKPSDVFNFLLFVLGTQAMMVLPPRLGLAWIGLFYLLDSTDRLMLRDPNNLVEIVFNLAAFVFVALLGYALQTAESARRRNQQLLADLQAAQEQVKDLAVAEERNRLAREIHDGLGHYLTATAMQVQGARAVLESNGVAIPLAAGALNKAETLLQEALTDVRRSVAALRSAPSASRSLAASLADLVNQPGQQAGLAVQFAQIGACRPLPLQVELTLYRVAQEGLTNVRKHAHTTQAAVTLTYASDKVQLLISDKGQGCVSPTGGYGLLGLQERVQLVGGTVNIHSAPGQGFALAVEIPVSNGVAHDDQNSSGR